MIILKYDQIVVSIVVTGSVYVLNLLDAAIAGAQSKRKFNLYFSGDLLRRAGVGVAYRF